jgi:hypothetical protein
MMAMFGLRLKPPTSQTTLALHFVPLPMLAISNAKILVVITFNDPIVHLRSTTRNLKVSLKIISLSLALCHSDLLLCEGSANSLPNALHYAMPKFSTSMGRSPPKEPAFISVLIDIQSRLETAETAKSVSMHFSKSTLTVLLKPRTTRLSLKPTKTLWVISSFVVIMTYNVSSP